MRETNPLSRLHNMIVTSAKDFSVETIDLYTCGIIVGWDDNSHTEFILNNRMTIEQAKDNRLDHKAFMKLRNHYDSINE